MSIVRHNILQQWSRSIDRPAVIAYIILITFSLILVATTSSAVAGKIGLVGNYFSSRQVIYLAAGFIIMIAVSTLNKTWVKRIALAGFLLNLVMLVLVRFLGYEVKGAIRWIRIFDFSYQPSEFMKPFFAVVVGWFLSLKYYDHLPGFQLSIILYLVLAVLLVIQPDVGMLLLVTAVFITQLFVAGLPTIWIMLTIMVGFSGTIGCYLFLPHVASRINSFIDPDSSENYQISKSLLAFEEGGLYGKGPGEGSIKQDLPDSHTDFIFAAAGEEFGAIICTVIITVFAFIVIRTLIRISKENDKFVQFAGVGLITQFGLQSAINTGVTLNLLPTKGMTLPFISYGGSSTLSISVAIGMLLALTRSTTSLVQYKKVIQ